MRSLCHKLLGDLTIQKGRTVLAVLVMAAGMFAVGTLLGLADMQRTVMDQAHRLSVPSHLNLILQIGVDQSLVEKIRQLPGVAGVDPLSQITVHAKTGSDAHWRLATLVVRPDYARQKYDLMTLVSGAYPQHDNVSIERLSSSQAHIPVGDYISFKTGHVIVPARITGMVRHPFVKPPTFGGQLHFFASPQFAAHFGLPIDRYTQLLIRTVEPYDTDHARTVAGAIKRLLGSAGVGVNATLLQDPERHWGHAFFAGINLVLQVMAWATLVLASILLLNTIAAMLAQQAHQIGVLKALGARARTIYLHYGAEVMLLSLGAFLLSVPAAALAAYYGTRWLVDLFNVDMPTFSYSASALGWTAAGGFGIPLMVACSPIHRAARMPVSVAIANYGLGSDFGIGTIDRWLERGLRRAQSPVYALTIGNVFRRKTRLLWTQVVLMTAGLTFLVIMSLLASIRLTLDNELSRTKFDVRLGLTVDQDATTLERLAREIPQTTGAEAWARYPLELSLHNKTLRQAATLGSQIVALPVVSALYRPLVVNGRWFAAADAGQKVLVINDDTARLNGLRIGQSVAVLVSGRSAGQWQIIGTYRWLAGANFAVEPAYAPLDTLRSQIGRGEVSSLLHLTADIRSQADETAFMDRLKELFDAHDIALDYYTTVAKREQRDFARNQFKPVTGLLLGLATLIAVVAGMGLAGTLGLNVLQRVREIGVLRALGASSWTVGKLFLLEGLFHGWLSWLLSVPLALLLTPLLAQRLGLTMLKIKLDYQFDYHAVILWLLLVTSLSALAALWPAYKAARLSPHDNLNH